MLLAALATGVSACGDDTEAAIKSAPPAASTSAAAATTVQGTTGKPECPFTAAMVAEAIRSEVSLLRAGNNLCVYGTPAGEGRADQRQPIAKLQWQETPLADAREAAEREGEVESRSDLSEGTFAIDQQLKRGRYRETLVFDGNPGTWTVSIAVPAGAEAEGEAQDRVDALFDLMN